MGEDDIAGLTEFQQRAAAAAVVKMLSGKHFSICDLNNIAQAIGAKHRLGGRDYDALISLHCVDWSDMGHELASMTRQKCLELLGLPPPVVNAEATAPGPKAAGGPRPRLAFWRKP